MQNLEKTRKKIPEKNAVDTNAADIVTPNLKSPRESYITNRKIVTPDLLNPNQTLFGGHLMSWIDEVAFMVARRHSGIPYVVTANIDNIQFHMPLKMGEHIFLSGQVYYTGKTSMVIGVQVEKEDPYTGQRQIANEAFLTFVALDQRGKPTTIPELKLENELDHERYNEAKLRIKIRKRFQNFLNRKLNKTVK